MSQKSYVKCLECGTLNLNRDYCENCSSIINVTLKRQLDREKKMQQEIEDERIKGPSKVDKFFNDTTDHPNIIVRSFSKFIYGVWLFLGMIVGAIIAGFISVVTG